MAGKAWQYLKIDEGLYEKGMAKILRILEGAETDLGSPHFGPVSRATRVAQ